MWVIIAKNDRSEIRDNILSEILEIEKDNSPDVYIKKRGNSYMITSQLSDAVIYKQKTSCERLIKRFNNSNRNDYRSVYYWIKDHVLTFRRLNKVEWNKMCDLEIENLNFQYQIQKNKIEKKRNLIR